MVELAVGGAAEAVVEGHGLGGDRCLLGHRQGSAGVGGAVVVRGVGAYGPAVGVVEGVRHQSGAVRRCGLAAGGTLRLARLQHSVVQRDRSAVAAALLQGAGGDGAGTTRCGDGSVESRLSSRVDRVAERLVSGLAARLGPARQPHSGLASERVVGGVGQFGVGV